MDDRSNKNHQKQLVGGKCEHGTPWTFFDVYQEHYTKVLATLGRECRGWKESETDKAIVDFIIWKQR